ncbi:unnamed protein product, partial [Gulo gulo]
MRDSRLSRMLLLFSLRPGVGGPGGSERGATRPAPPGLPCPPWHSPFSGFTSAHPPNAVGSLERVGAGEHGRMGV